MRRIVLASHHKLADGMKDTIQFLSGMNHVYAISAYVDETRIEEQIDELFKIFDDSDEIFILTDMMGGSVNQKFYGMMNEHTHVICGMNLPLALTLALQPENELTDEQVAKLVAEARKQLIYMNTYQLSDMNDDE